MNLKEHYREQEALEAAIATYCTKYEIAHPDDIIQWALIFNEFHQLLKEY